ncbi:MAG: site-specific integrase [Chthoniobacterales bacterium]
MQTSQRRKNGAFQKVGECLYRYSSSGVYYARIKSHGKEIRRSLATADRPIAQRRLRALKDEEAQVDRSRGRMSLGELCDRFLRTVQHLKPKTVERKTLIVRRLKEDWPTGPGTQLTKIRPSDLQVWLNRRQLGPTSHNLHAACVKEIFNMAVSDGLIARSPAESLKSVRIPRPIRPTPTFQEFRGIVENIRSQQFHPDAEESADFVEFLGLAGLGQAEASTLTWGDIDWKRKRIITFRHKTMSGFAIPLYPQLRPLLERRQQASHCTGPNDRVFLINDAKKGIANACRRLGLRAYSHRAFRRMFITRAIEKGVDPKVIAEWQGHKDGGKLILQTYSHVNPVHSLRMADLMTEEPVKEQG